MEKHSFSFTLNGRVVEVEGEATNRPLLDYLRASGLTGSKQGCAEGDCGACTVAIVDDGPNGERRFRAINSCITLLPMVAGRTLVTVEGVGSVGGGPHPVQSALVHRYGSQCGYCTPGFVMSMFEGYYRTDLDGPVHVGRDSAFAGRSVDVADQLAGNLCRCTGYRPIREAMEDARACPREAGDRFVQLCKKPDDGRAELTYGARGQVFHRPTSIADLCALLDQHPDAVIVAGATEIGVDINKKGKVFPRLVSTDAIAELASITRTDEAWIVGGGASLTAIDEALGKELPPLHKMLMVFASRQIRNRATLAGNLVTASPIGDMAPVLLALDARVRLVSSRGEREVGLDQFFIGYRRTVMEPGEVLRSVVIPHIPEGVIRLFDSYKVSKRRELDISIVAACFSIDLDGVKKDGTIVKARLGYGGVAATPIRAKKAEAALEGSKWSRASVDRALAALAEEIKPISDARGSAEYRRALVGSLFEKFFAGEESQSQDAPLDYVIADQAPQRPDTSRSLPHESGLGHTMGTALYVDDQAQRRPMLELWPVRSPHAHAKILRRNADVARRAPGVSCVLFAEDIPGHNDVGAIRHDETLLAKDEALFHGHMVAIVVGESYEVCKRAAALVEVDYEPLPAILTIEEAMRQGSYHNAPHVMRRGDVEAALASSPHKLQGTFSMGGQEHFYLETHAAWAEVTEDGEVFVSSSTQHPSEIQAVVSHVLDVPRNKVTVESPRMGGGFGGKETQGNTWAALAALAAKATGKPVRVQLDRDVDMQLTGKRHPFWAEFEVGYTEEGLLTALKASLVSNGGWALDLSESICDRALFHIDNGYYIPSVEVTGRVAKTNIVSHTAFRGFGGPQGMLVIEEIMDRIARRLGLLPEVVRRRNLYRGTGETNTTHYGQEVGDERLAAMWASLSSSAELAARREEIRAYNARSPRIKRGIAITPVKFGISFTATFLNQAGALVLLYRDGTAQVNHGGTEMGQGLYTKMRGVAMRELGLRAEAVRVMRTRTDKVPNTSATAASSGADLNGAAVKAACETLRARLLPFAAQLLGAPEASIVFADGHASTGAGDKKVPLAEVIERAYFTGVSLSATGFYRTPDIHYDRTKGRGKPFHYFACGAAVTEVEVDGYSGMKRILRTDILHDVGDSLNPGVDRGQIEGAYVQGVGWLTGEELLWDDKGRLLTHSASTYQIPAVSDAPRDLRVTLLPDAAQHNTIHGSKAVGEPPFMLAISAREAIRDAVAAFGPEGGEVALPSPATHEAIFFAAKRRMALA